MSSFTASFAYEIGDIVYMKTANHNIESLPTTFMIVERLAQQCPGGIQLHYKLHGKEGTALEILISKEMPEYTEQNPERREEMKRDMRESKELSREMWKPRPEATAAVIDEMKATYSSRVKEEGS